MDPTMQVANKLVALCKQQKWLEAVDTLYGPDIVSIEPAEMPPLPRRMEGIKDVRGKSEWWAANHEMHSCQVNGPWPHGDRFIVTYKIDVTAKAGPMAGKRATHEEAGLYTVKDGKIVHEEFFASME